MEMIEDAFGRLVMFAFGCALAEMTWLGLPIAIYAAWPVVRFVFGSGKEPDTPHLTGTTVSEERSRTLRPSPLRVSVTLTAGMSDQARISIMDEISGMDGVAKVSIPGRGAGAGRA